MVVKFSEIYGNLMCKDIPKRMLNSKENRGGYLSGECMPLVPQEFQKQILHDPDGFVVNYCEEY